MNARAGIKQEPLTTAEHRQLNAAWRQADRARREASAVLQSMYRNNLRGRRT